MHIQKAFIHHFFWKKYIINAINNYLTTVPSLSSYHGCSYFMYLSDRDIQALIWLDNWLKVSQLIQGNFISVTSVGRTWNAKIVEKSCANRWDTGWDHKLLFLSNHSYCELLKAIWKVATCLGFDTFIHMHDASSSASLGIILYYTPTQFETSWVIDNFPMRSPSNNNRVPNTKRYFGKGFFVASVVSWNKDFAIGCGTRCEGPLITSCKNVSAPPDPGVNHDNTV